MVRNMKKHILIAALSVTPRPTKYALGDKVAEANQSPLALLQLLPEDRLPDEVIILCTSEIAKVQFPQFKEHIESGEFSTHITKPIRVSALDISDGKNEEEIWEILRCILKCVPENAYLTLDLTHGYRSFSFLYFTAALYLKALRNVGLISTFYGNVEIKEEPKPLLDLSLILEMVEWFFATRIFRETGQANYIINLLEPFTKIPEGVQGKDCMPYSQIRKLSEVFSKATSAYEQALPIEFGLEANRLHQLLEKDLPGHLMERMPLPEELFGQVKAFIEPYALSQINDNDKKMKLFLDYTEINRQAALVDEYFGQGYINSATALMREWIVNVALFHQEHRQGKGIIAGIDWLPYKKRRPIEYSLGLMMKFVQSKAKENGKVPLTEEQKWLAEKWDYITNKRNGLSHCGFKEDNVHLSLKAIEEIKEKWQELKDSIYMQEKWELYKKQGEGMLLICALGNSKGSLYSALATLEPDYLFVILSDKTKGAINEILEKVNWQGELAVYCMEDPFAGFMEKKLASAEAEPLMAKAEEVVYNLTGGTTVMQHVLNQITRKNKATKQVAFIDRRSLYEQHENPYVIGEMILLEEEKG